MLETEDILWIVDPEKVRNHGAVTQGNELAFAKRQEGEWHRGKQVSNISGNVECLLAISNHE